MNFIDGGGSDFTVTCNSCGEHMTASLPRELGGFWNYFVCQSAPRHCDECGEDFEKHCVMYRCHDCEISACMHCARHCLNLPSIQDKLTAGKRIVEVRRGDVLFSLGDTARVIHHAILIAGPLQPEPLDGGTRAEFELSPGVEMWGIPTVESKTSQRGVDTWWLPGLTLFSRDPHDEEAYIIGMVEDTGTISRFAQPCKFKIALNPIRKVAGGPGIDRDHFDTALEHCAEVSQKWTANVGLVGNVLFHTGVLHDEKYTDDASKVKLIEKLQKNWEKPTSCAGVPVQVWQRYFVETYPEVEAAEMILQYIPCWANTTAPSQLCKELSRAGWAVEDNFAAD